MDYSSSTMYLDHAISRTEFHWQSQSTTTPTKEKGLRHLEHRERGITPLLFVREHKQGGMGLDEDRRVIVSQSFAGHGPFADMVLRYNGKRLSGPQAGCSPPAEEYVAWHRRHVFQGDARATG